MINVATKVSKEPGPVHMAISVTPSDIADAVFICVPTPFTPQKELG